MGFLTKLPKRSTWTEFVWSSTGASAKASAAFGSSPDAGIACCSVGSVAPGGPSMASGPRRSPRRSAEEVGGWGSNLLNVPFSWAGPWFSTLWSYPNNDHISILNWNKPLHTEMEDRCQGFEFAIKWAA